MTRFSNGLFKLHPIDRTSSNELGLRGTGANHPGHALFNGDDLPIVSDAEMPCIELIGASSDQVAIVLVPAACDLVPQGEIWIDKYIKDGYLKNEHEVHYDIVHHPAYQALLVECLIRDCFVSRRDMLCFIDEIHGKCISEGQRLTISNASSTTRPTTIQISQIYGANGVRLKRGAICNKNSTRLSYRSLTGVFHILIQVSAEMFDWDAYGYMQYQRATNGFLAELMRRWLEESAWHDIEIIFFARHYYQTQESDDLLYL